MIMNENVATSCIILFLHRRISHFYNVSNAYVMRQKNDHYVNIMLRQSLFLSGVRQQLQRMLAPIKKGAQEVCEPTGGPYLQVLTMCKIVNTHPITRLRQSHKRIHTERICLIHDCICLCLTPVSFMIVCVCI